MAQPAKRRIQPQLIPPTHAQPAAVGNIVGSPGPQGNGHSHINPLAQPGSANATQQIPDPKEDSEIAARLGMKGRRVFVTIQKGQQNNIDLKKVWPYMESSPSLNIWWLAEYTSIRQLPIPADFESPRHHRTSTGPGKRQPS